MSDPDPLSIEKGLIVAPAGCGKTHLITTALANSSPIKPVLVLTHTNAGVAALRHRLNGLNIPKQKYILATIDGWALRLVSKFPMRSNYDLGPTPAKPPYRDIRKAAWQLIKRGCISEILKATYSHILVDEYQDCSTCQHAMIFRAAEILPTCILGDPMQAIFGFSKDDPLPDWEKHVCGYFPIQGKLTTPWRWINIRNKELGLWLLDARSTLERGNPLDLNKAPSSVIWQPLKGSNEDYPNLVKAARCGHKAKEETTLVIGESISADSRHRVAKSVPGIITVEPVDLKDLTEFARALDLKGRAALGQALEFAGTMITNINVSGTLERVKTIVTNRNRRPPSDLEVAAIKFANKPTYSNFSELLSECTRQTGCRTFRPAVLRGCFRALSYCIGNPEISFEEAATRVREENRSVGRQLPKHAIGSTLLLKGLEADHVVVLNADLLDVKNLYVALTRGARTITVCSKKQILNV